jgi:WhiB family transcriptional regulator, redox-sensing transcriptional regulator
MRRRDVNRQHARTAVPAARRQEWLPVTVDGQLPCRTYDPDLFFADSPADIERAKVICRDCPVRQRCLTSALQRHEPWGVWGGEYFDDGIVIPRKRPLGRPRKHRAPGR